MEVIVLCSGNYKEHIRGDTVSSYVRMDSACKDGRWIELVQRRAQWQALILSALNLWVLLTENQLISNMDLKKTGCEGGRWMELVQDRAQC